MERFSRDSSSLSSALQADENQGERPYADGIEVDAPQTSISRDSALPSVGRDSVERDSVEQNDTGERSRMEAGSAPVEASPAQVTPTQITSTQATPTQATPTQVQGTEPVADEQATQGETRVVESSANTQAGIQETAGSELSPDQIQATAIFVESGVVNALDTDQIYQFSVTESGIFTAQLSALTADADVQLIADRNQNGVVDQGEILAWQWERGNSPESIRKFIDAGEYLVRVKSHQESAASYQLSTDFTASATDELSFSINLNLRGLDGLNEQAQAGIYRAAEYWENVITHSSLGRAQVVNINIFGTNTHPNGLEVTEELPYLALGGPQSYLGDANNRLITSRGFSLVNMYYENVYNTRPGYLEEIMRHEFGHVLGIGTNWTPRQVLVGGEALVINDFVDPDNRTYRANTYAGQAYGELIGELQAPIPLDSVKAHWSESNLDRELMTPRAEGVGDRLPVSPVTIASLRDLGWNVNFGAAEVSTLSALVSTPNTAIA